MFYTLLGSSIVEETFIETYEMCIVDWSEDWSTPWGLAIDERRIKPSYPVITPS